MDIGDQLRGENIVDQLRDEADLCRNETATDIADLLDKAADEIMWLRLCMDAYKKQLADSLNNIF